jgi:hypothetical protein
MAENFSPQYKRLFVTLWVALIVTCVYLIFRKAPERIGVCESCCTMSGEKICKPNYSESVCREYNRRKVEGRNWSFVETKQGRCQ